MVEGSLLYMDRILRFGLLVWFAVFLALYWRQSQNGRYIPIEINGRIEVLDTRVGQIYFATPCDYPGYGPGCLDSVSEHEKKK